MKITVIGTGYVGLTTGTGFAEMGHEVFCIDIDKKKIENLKKGKLPIYEPGLDKLVLKNFKAKRLNFSTDLAKPVQESQVIFIAVGTPPLPDGRANLQYVEAATEDIAKSLAKLPEKGGGFKVIVNKSTVPIGTGDFVSQIIRRHYNGPFEVVSNPEFLREGQAVHDVLHPDRVVLGIPDNSPAKKVMRQLYRPFTRKILITDVKTAEMVKYASNSFLATSISFINSIANLSEKVGADVVQVAEGMRLDKRIGKKAFLDAGVGYGGSCFPKDVQALIQVAEENATDFQILRAVEEINQIQKESVLEKIERLVPRLKGEKIAVWGVAFKPGTDDVREAPALPVIKNLLEKGVKISAFDPVAEENARKVFPQVHFAKTPVEALKNAGCLVILTEWPEFKKIDKNLIKKELRLPNIVDGRNVFSPKEMEKLGFNYLGVGREMLEPKISIIIPVTPFISSELEKNLPYFFALDYQNFEVIILPDRLKAKDKSLLQKFGEKLKIIPTDNPSPAFKRNLAAKVSSGEILAFTDDDAYPEKDWLKKAIPHFKDPRIAAVGGPAITPPEASLWQAVSSSVYESFLGGGNLRFRYLPQGQAREVDDLPSVNLLVSRRWYQKVGGFETFWPGEDTKLCRDLIYRLGKNVVYDPGVRVWHLRRTTLLHHLKQVANYALHRGFFVKRFPENSLRPSYFLPSIFVLFLALNLALTLFIFRGEQTLAINSGFIWQKPSYLLFNLSWAVVFFYFVLLSIVSLMSGLRYKNPLVGILTFPAILLTHMIYGISFLKGLLTHQLKS